MTSAHRPTLDPAKGKMEADTGIVHSRAMPAHMKLKMRRQKTTAAALAEQALEDPKVGPAASIALAAKPESAESAESAGSVQSGEPEPVAKSLQAVVQPALKSALLEKESGVAETVSGPVSGPESETRSEPGPAQPETLDDGKEPVEPESEDESEDDSDSEAELMRQLETIQKDRQAPQPTKRKRAWMDETVFSNETTQQSSDYFVNDSLHTDFHRNFMKKYTR